MKNSPNNHEIAVFDSGIGGLTVAAAIRSMLPAEDLVYFGDLLHLPYGSKSRNAVLEFTRSAVNFLVRRDIKALVIACNTATSVAKYQLEKEVSIPVVGVIVPGARSACSVSKSNRIGIIGTTRTVASNAYPEAIHRVNPDMYVFQKATPLLVPLIEEGWIDHPVMKIVLSEYLRDFQGKAVDTIVLGCTHYPLIREAVQEILTDVHIVDSAHTTAVMLKEILCRKNILSEKTESGIFRVFLTDTTDYFQSMAQRILGNEVCSFHNVTLKYPNGRGVYTAQEKGV
jgi:glutamate racemase